MHLCVKVNTSLLKELEEVDTCLFPDVYFTSMQPNCLRPNLSVCFCVSVSVHQAEARLAAKRAARAEAREIRMRELERQQKEVTSRKHAKPEYMRKSLMPGGVVYKDILSLVGTVWVVWTTHTG